MKRSKTPPIKELRAICRPHKKWLGVVNSYFPIISIYLTKLFITFELSANFVTGLMVFLAILTGILLSFQSYYLHIAAVFSLLLSYALDWSDGEVARYYLARDGVATFEENDDKLSINFKAEGSLIGNYLDYIYHTFVKVSVFIGISVYFYTQTKFSLSMISLIIVLLFLLIQVFSSFTQKVFLDHLKYHEISHQFKKYVTIDDTSSLYFKLFGTDGITGPTVYTIISFFVIMKWQHWLVIISFLLYCFMFIKKVTDVVLGKHDWKI